MGTDAPLGHGGEPDERLIAAAPEPLVPQLKLTAAMLKAPRVSLTSAKEYIRTAPDMSTPGAVEYARNLHAVINAAAEITKPR